MKNISTPISIAALIGVIVLFVLHFTKAKTGVETTIPVNKGSFKVAYFEMDSLQNNFEYYKEVAKELGGTEQSVRTELAGRKNEIIQKAKEYQAKGQQMSQAQAMEANQDLEQRQKEYQQLEQAKGQQLQDESFKRLQDVKKKIEDYLKEYNATKGYSLIITNSQELIYYKDTTYNITKDLIKGLNDLYKKKK